MITGPSFLTVSNSQALSRAGRGGHVTGRLPHHRGNDPVILVDHVAFDTLTALFIGLDDVGIVLGEKLFDEILLFLGGGGQDVLDGYLLAAEINCITSVWPFILYL